MSWNSLDSHLPPVSAFSRIVEHLKLSIKFLTFPNSVLMGELNQMLTFIVTYTHHMSIYWVSVFIVVTWLTSRIVGSSWNIYRVGGTFSIHAILLKGSLDGTVPAHCFQSFTILSFLVSAFTTSPTNVCRQWNFLTLSTILEGFPAFPLLPVLLPLVVCWNFPDLDFFWELFRYCT